MGVPTKEFNGYQEIAVLNQRIRSILLVLRTLAAHMGTSGQTPAESALHLSGRIGAIGRVALAPVFCEGTDLESLVLDELLLQAARTEQFSVGGVEVRLTSKVAELMSLVIHELATNSVKYGALSQSQAKIKVAWEITTRRGSSILKFEWLECAVQLMMGAGRIAGFGSEVVERLIARELRGDGQMIFLADGVHYTIEFPLVER